MKVHVRNVSSKSVRSLLKAGYAVIECMRLDFTNAGEVWSGDQIICCGETVFCVTVDAERHLTEEQFVWICKRLASRAVLDGVHSFTLFRPNENVKGRYVETFSVDSDFSQGVPISAALQSEFPFVRKGFSPAYTASLSGSHH